MSYARAIWLAAYPSVGLELTLDLGGDPPDVLGLPNQLDRWAEGVGLQRR